MNFYVFKKIKKKTTTTKKQTNEQEKKGFLILNESFHLFFSPRKRKITFLIIRQNRIKTKFSCTKYGKLIFYFHFRYDSVGAVVVAVVEKNVKYNGNFKDYFSFFFFFSIKISFLIFNKKKKKKFLKRTTRLRNK